MHENLHFCDMIVARLHEETKWIGYTSKKKKKVDRILFVGFLFGLGDYCQSTKWIIITFTVYFILIKRILNDTDKSIFISQKKKKR